MADLVIHGEFGEVPVRHGGHRRRGILPPSCVLTAAVVNGAKRCAIRGVEVLELCGQYPEVVVLILRRLLYPNETD